MLSTIPFISITLALRLSIASSVLFPVTACHSEIKSVSASQSSAVLQPETPHTAFDFNPDRYASASDPLAYFHGGLMPAVNSKSLPSAHSRKLLSAGKPVRGAAAPKLNGLPGTSGSAHPPLGDFALAAQSNLCFPSEWSTALCPGA